MSDKIKILVVDDNLDFIGVMGDYIGSQSDMEVVGTAKDGLEAVEIIKEKEIDLIVLDIIMPRLDGLGVLEEMNKMTFKTKPKVVVMSGVGQDNITQKALALGAEYYVMKPFDLEVFMRRIRQMYGSVALGSEKEASSENEYEKDIVDMMHNLSISTNIKGYYYIKDSISIILTKDGVINSITKDIYPHVAEKHNTTASRVERAIRHAIEKAWKDGEEKKFNKVIGYKAIGSGKKPTNGEFLTIISEKLRLKK